MFKSNLERFPARVRPANDHAEGVHTGGYQLRDRNARSTDNGEGPKIRVSLLEAVKKQMRLIDPSVCSHRFIDFATVGRERD
jgi:hypothetical protein